MMWCWQKNGKTFQDVGGGKVSPKARQGTTELRKRNWGAGLKMEVGGKGQRLGSGSEEEMSLFRPRRH